MLKCKITLRNDKIKYIYVIECTCKTCCREIFASIYFTFVHKIKYCTSDVCFTIFYQKFQDIFTTCCSTCGIIVKIGMC